MGLIVPFFPQPSQALALIAVVIGLVVLALCLPVNPLPAARSRRVAPPQVFGAIGAVGMTLIMLGTFVVPGWGSRPSATVMFFSLLTILVAELGALLWLSHGGTWDDRHRLALVIGLLGFFLAFGILKDCESFTGRGLVSVTALGLILRLQRRAQNSITRANSPACDARDYKSGQEA
jgi:hypothetical protein